MSRRPAIVAVDGGGSKIDAALLRRDGTVLGAARRRATEYDENGGDQHLSQIVAAVEAAQADAGIRPGRLPVADLGVYCLAGADLPQDDRKIARWLQRRGIATTEMVRNDTFAVLRAGHRPALGRGRGVRVRDELLGGGAGRPRDALPGRRRDLRRLGRRRGHGADGRLVRGARRGRPGGPDQPARRACPPTSGSAARAS